MKYAFYTAAAVAAAVFLIGCRPPLLSISPGTELTVNNGESIEFIVEIIDPENVEEKSIQWLVNGGPIEGATESSFIYNVPLVSTEDIISITAEVVDKRLARNEISSILTVLPSPYAHISVNGSFTYTLNAGSETRDVYFIFTNTSASQTAQQPNVSANFDARDAAPEEQEAPRPLPQPKHPAALRGIPEVTEFNNNPPSFGPRTGTSSRSLYTGGAGEALYDTEGVGGGLYVYDSGTPVSGTCRKVVPANGKTLNIWVEDAWWTDLSNDLLGKVNNTMVNALANKFLKAGDNNDIYEWVSTIFGGEWGSHDFSNLIAPNNEITIFLYDIDNDGIPSSGEGRAVGLFDSTNNFTEETYSDSNERIMFYLDAPLFANDSDDNGSWDINADFWPNEVVSTLAHEFQHMIHFYQKQVKNNSGGTDTWLNEMCSMVAEDLVSDKIRANGPRGVSYSDGTAGTYPITADRLARYNYHNDENLVYWPPNSLDTPMEEFLKHYSLSYSFGAYLARNYNGPALFQNIVQNGYTNRQAVEAALTAGGYNIAFARALQRWGVAVLLSDRTNAPGNYRYNLGEFFTSSLGGITYNAGSINLYNYQYTYSDPQLRGPKIYTGSSIGQSTLNPASNTFYHAGSGLTGEKSWDITLPDNVEMSVVFK
jgi:hypothetical protein